MKKLALIAAVGFCAAGCARGDQIVLRADDSFGEEDARDIESAVIQWSRATDVDIAVEWVSTDLDLIRPFEGSGRLAKMRELGQIGVGKCRSYAWVLPSELWNYPPREFEENVLHEIGHFFCVDHSWDEGNPGGLLMSYEKGTHACVDLETAEAFCAVNWCGELGPRSTCDSQ